MDIICRNLSDTAKLAKKFAGDLLACGKGIILYEAPMGAGKTTFTATVVKHLNKRACSHSPTFTIINQYAENIFHIDLYRIEHQDELLNTDFPQIISGENFVFIEWSEKCKFNYPEPVFQVKIDILNDSERRFIIKKNGISDIK